ncbi:MAG: biliverdin-producing heme oxygenase [Glaciimonas sp.]|nr:biliverdin-producing heme oxygenase [Glaciimonas sp.]
MNVMISLREATWPMHLRLEKRLSIKDRFSELACYRHHLALLESFYTAAEAEWSPWLAAVLSDLPARYKAPLLGRDLAALGGTPILGAIVPTATDSAFALGSFYVLEGATLGGQHLLPLVERRLGLSAQHGASYLASYGSEVAVMWQRFGAAVESHCQTAHATGCAIAGANATFQAMENWLCGAQA